MVAMLDGPGKSADMLNGVATLEPGWLPGVEYEYGLAEPNEGAAELEGAAAE